MKRLGHFSLFVLGLILTLTSGCFAEWRKRSTLFGSMKQNQEPVNFRGNHTRPNILFIMADDLGHNDIGYNNPSVLTPTLDDLAARGRILTQHYTQPMCTPSRSALFTGRYPFRSQMQHFILTMVMPHCVPLNLKFLPELLRDSGYTTHLVGKWHQGYCQKGCLPTQRGFDSFFGLYGGMGDHYSHETVPPDYVHYDFRDGDHVDSTVQGSHATEVLTDRAVKVIESHRYDVTPFFLFLAYTVPHAPLQVPEPYLRLYQNVSDVSRRTALAMISHMDAGVGRVVDSLRDNNLLENTLIVFASDNGGDPTAGHSNAPWRGGKGSLWEGGTRTPAFISGPMLENGSAKHDGLFHLVDWYATLLSVAGICHAEDRVDSLDQTDMILKGSPSIRNELVYNIDMEVPHIFGQAAVRSDRYKLIWGYEGDTDGWGATAGRSWNMPWNMQLLGLDLESDVITRSREMKTNERTSEERKRRGDLMRMKSFNAENLDSGSVYLFDLHDDPYERTNLATDPKYSTKVLTLKRMILELIRKEYVKPQPHVIDNWLVEAEKALEGNSWNTGWCDNLTITV